MRLINALHKLLQAPRFKRAMAWMPLLRDGELANLRSRERNISIYSTPKLHNAVMLPLYRLDGQRGNWRRAPRSCHMRSKLG